MENICATCKHWKLETQKVTSIPGFTTDLMGDMIIIRLCDLGHNFYSPSEYTCSKYKLR